MTIADTRDAGRAISSTSPLTLSFLASMYTDLPAWKEYKIGMAADKGTRVTAADNAMDCVATAQVWAAQQACLAEPRVRALYEQHLATSAIAGEMRMTGFLVDQARRASLAKELHDLRNGRRALITRLLGPEARGWRFHPNNLRAVIFERHRKPGLPCFGVVNPWRAEGWTGRRACSVNKEALLMVLAAADCPAEVRRVVRAYWQAEAAAKAATTYVTSVKVTRAIGQDGRLRAGWNSAGADTGRWSCSGPNLQNLSEAHTDSAIQGEMPNMRSMYRAGPGRVLVHADFSQLELRVMAAISGDKVLAAALASGDVYEADAREWFTLPAVNGPTLDAPVPVLKAARKQAKIAHLGAQYGAGDSALWLQALRQVPDMLFTTACDLRASFHRTYARTVAWWDEEMARVMQVGYSESRIMGRRRIYPAPPAPPEVANYPIQATAADIVNAGIVRLAGALAGVPGAALVTQEHDAFTSECSGRSAGTVARIMQDVLSGPFTIEGQSYAFPVKVTMGERWSDV